MTLTTCRNDEEQAAALFTSINGGSWKHSSSGGVGQIDSVLPDGTRVALLARRDAPAPGNEQTASDSTLDWSFSELEAWWEVSTIGHATPARLNRDLLPIIVELEAEGTKRVSVERNTPSTPRTERLRELGVRLVFRITDETPGRIHLSEASNNGATTPSVLVALAEEYAEQSAADLEQADADERHLWIWAANDHDHLMAAIGGLLPGVDLSIDEHIDRVWIASECEHPAVVSWDLSGWKRHRPAQSAG